MDIEPWYGPPRGFDFEREVQPVLDKYCVGCHDGSTVAVSRQSAALSGSKDGGALPSRRYEQGALPDLRRDQGGCVVYRGGQLDGQLVQSNKQELLGIYGAVFDPSYVALRQFVRVGGLESDLYLLPPREFAADTSELIQMLAKGHHNVKLDADAWDRLVTWI